MNPTDSTFQQALSKLLVEVLNGPPGNEAFVLNPGDPGLLGQLNSIDARSASTRDVPGKTTIASHVAHVLYGFQLMNRWAQGEENPFANADWEAAWKRTTVSESEWNALRRDLRNECDAWRKAVAARSDWDDLAASGSLASAVHTAYHLGAIRQILATQG
jgi:hypothetical protein